MLSISSVFEILKFSNMNFSSFSHFGSNFAWIVIVFLLPKRKKGIWWSSCLDQTPWMPLKKLKIPGGHAQFIFLKHEFERHMLVISVIEEDVGDDVEAYVHIQFSIRAYLLFLVRSPIFTNNNSIYTHVVYLQFFRNLEMVDYAWGSQHWLTCIWRWMVHRSN